MIIHRLKPPRFTAADVTLLQAYMADKRESTFIALRRAEPYFADWSDGEIHEVALASGFVVSR